MSASYSNRLPTNVLTTSQSVGWIFCCCSSPACIYSVEPELEHVCRLCQQIMDASSMDGVHLCQAKLLALDVVSQIEAASSDATRDAGEGQCAIQVDPADSGCRINRGCASLSSQNLGLGRCRSKLAVRGCDRRFIEEQASERSATSESAAACRASTKLWCSNCCTHYQTEADSEDHRSGALSGEQQQRQQQPRNWYSVVPTSSPGAHFDSSASKAYRQASKASSISSRASSTSKESAI